MKVVVAAFNQEKALVGAFSVITNLRMELFQALDLIHVAVVVDLAVGLVEVQVAVGHGGVGLAVPVEAGAARALARGAVARHVVDDSVHDDPGQGRLSWRYTRGPTYITPTLLHCCTMLMKLSLLPDLLDRM